MLKLENNVYKRNLSNMNLIQNVFFDRTNEATSNNININGFFTSLYPNLNNVYMSIYPNYTNKSAQQLDRNGFVCKFLIKFSQCNKIDFYRSEKKVYLSLVLVG